ncbi:helix-turn-helix domain-containing protein [Rhodosalinus sp. FB01]|uniref:helix-turn-helix domain-containing protein n=1 Tax=Rhodosalinus sp. FB01 TaxID=3239194 RepID=UPI003523D975
MIRRKPSRADAQPVAKPKRFDDFDLRLGDVMRGERATLGKSLLDVQRELRIRASYIAAIENSDPSAFDTPGFIAGYVRSYARYLGMDPDRAFAEFCAESGFSPAHGMSKDASSVRKPTRRGKPATTSGGARDPFVQPATPFIPRSESLFSRVEPGAVGSLVVLAALVGAIGFGGWSVLREIQRVQLSPVDQTPVVLAELDPLDGAGSSEPDGPSLSTEALERLYRPQALDVPVMIARDAPISTLDPETTGAFARADRPAAPSGLDLASPAVPERAATTAAEMPQVVEAEAPEVKILAVRPAWIRVRGADGSVIFEKILDAGEAYTLPRTEGAPTLRAGMSGSLYFEVNGELYGPAGQGTSTIRDVALSVDALTQGYALADFGEDPELAKVVAMAEAREISGASE